MNAATNGAGQAKARAEPVQKKHPRHYRDAQVIDYPGGERLIIRNAPRDGENWADIEYPFSTTKSKED